MEGENNMARILFLVNDLTVVGGSTKVTYQLANHWSNQHEIEIVGLFKSREEAPFELNPRVKTHVLYQKMCHIHELKTYFHFLKQGKWGECLKLVTTIAHLLCHRQRVERDLYQLTSEVDLIVIPDVHGISFLKREILKQKKVMLQLHNTASFITQNALIMRTLVRHQCDIDRLVLLTQSDQRAFESLGFEKTSFIYNEVEQAPMVVSRETMQTPDKIVFLGRLDSRKGVDLLVPLMSRLVAQYPSVRLYVYGEGPERENLERAIQEAGLEDEILLMGYTNSLTDVFSTASCFWLTSRWEGLPLTLLEALSYGVPTVAFRCFDGIYEIMPHEKAGFVILPEELDEFVTATVTLLTNGDKWQEISRQAQKESRRFSPEEIQTHWDELLGSLLKNEVKK